MGVRRREATAGQWTGYERLALLLFALVGIFSEVLSEKGETANALNAKCRDLFGCAVRKNCVQMKMVEESFDNATITQKLYNDLDRGIDYGCIFTSGCLDECNRCPLCQSSKQQLVDVLSGSHRDSGDECSVLVQCSINCVESAKSDFTKINYCLRHQCAFHCFDGSCPKCAAFTTRIFNQICVSGDLRRRVKDWKGHCYELFRGIVMAKFKEEFDKVGRLPAIGLKNPLPQAPTPVVVHSGDTGKK